jgi:phytoene dehydrogenase-like protein
MRKLLPFLVSGYNKPMGDFAQRAKSPLLRVILANLFMPEVPVWFVLLLLALLAERQIGLLAEGCPGFVRPIEERYRALGGEVSYGATVEEILVENDRSVGVRLADGTEHRAGAVVSAADGHGTIFGMLQGRYVDKRTRERYAGWTLIRPTIMVSFGVARDFRDEPHLTAILLEKPIAIGDDRIDGFSLRVFNYGSVFAPPGKTVIQAMFETKWQFWNDLQNDRPLYEAEKQRVADEVLSRLERHYPGVSSAVEVTDVATPYTTWRYTLNREGAYMGWLPTPKTIMAAIPRTLPGLSDFYMAGQWVLPGGGVPPCLYSGRHAVELLCHRDGREFVTATP